MITYQKENTDINVVYSVEYIDDPKVFELLDKGEEVEYKVKQFSSLDDAMTTYLIYLFWIKGFKTNANVFRKIYDVKLFEQIVLNGTVIRESWIEPRQNVINSLCNAVNKDVCRRLEQLEQESETQKALINKYESFIESYNAQEIFKSYIGG